MLGGIEVDVERLKEISAINKELILASKSSNTYASKALINDGFKYFGTFNFGTDGTGKNHKYKDVIQYWKWGNTPEDMTSNKARIHPILDYFYPSYTSNLERYNAHH